MINQKPTIYFDMDGVLADMRGYMDSHGIKYNPDGVYDITVDQKMWDDIRAIPHFYDKLEPLPGSIELFKKLSEKYDCQILTAVPKEKWNIDTARDDKISWAMRYLGDDVKINTVYRPEKKDFVKGKQSILVDDLPKNIGEWGEAGGTGILFTSADSFDFDKLNETILDFRLNLLQNNSNTIADTAVEKGDIQYA